MLIALIKILFPAVFFFYNNGVEKLILLFLPPPQELRGQLDSALKEVEEMRDARERQKEMVEAIVKQRDMYRTLLAQSTPLPMESPQVRILSLCMYEILLNTSRTCTRYY